MARKRKPIVPRWRAVEIDETKDFDEDSDLIAMCGKIRARYVFNENEHTFCCELTPSYALWFVEFVPEKFQEDEREREVQFDRLQEVATLQEDMIYMHVNSVDRMKKLEPESDDDRRVIEYVEELREKEKGSS